MNAQGQPSVILCVGMIVTGAMNDSVNMHIMPKPEWCVDPDRNRP
jgi:hypothetical protein